MCRVRRVASQAVTGVLQPVSWSHSLVRCRDGGWASRDANLGTWLRTAKRRAEKAVRQCVCKLRPPSALGLTRSVPPLFMHLTCLASRLAAGLPCLARHQSLSQPRRSNRKQDRHHLGSWPPVEALPHHLLLLVPSGLHFPPLSGFIPHRRPFSTLSKPSSRFAIVRRATAIPSASRS
jgi:hypothetical protein